jgi:hypothetical protein
MTAALFGFIAWAAITFVLIWWWYSCGERLL